MAIIDVVKWNAPANELVYKFPSEELSTATRLIVSTAQEAFVVLGGEISGPFLPGTHILDTGNIPILRRLVNIPFGGHTPFSAEVWFVQKTTPLNLLWGTTEPIPLLDPKFNVPVPIRCFGQLGIKISDSMLFLQMLAGTLESFNTTMIGEYFKAMVQTKVKSLISSSISRNNYSVFEINQHLDTLSEQLTKQLDTGFREFGVSIVNFFVQSVNFKQDDPAIVSLRESLAKRADMSIIGYTYTQERSLDILQSAAANEGTAGALAGAGLGLGMGAAVGNSVVPALNQTVSGILNPAPAAGNNAAVCINCQQILPENAKFCPECGTPQKISCCGMSLPAGTKFCPECGKSLSGTGGNDK